MTVTAPRPNAPARPPATKAHPNLALAVIAGAQLMVVLDATIVNIALPKIHQALSFSNAGLSWVLNAYTLVFGGLLLLGGRTGDLFGRRRMFTIGVLLFAGASLAGGFAPDKGFLLAMRAIQGAGGAIASPTALALITSTFEEGEDRNRALGVYAAVSGAGAAIGLILGGVLTDLLSWRWVLFVNAPIGIALAIGARFVIHETERRRSSALDVAGALTSTAGMAALVYGFIHAATPGEGWSNGITVGSFVVAIALLTGFVAVEARIRNPIMPLRLFASRTRVGSYVVMLVVGAAIFATFYFLTQYVQQVLGYSPLKAGFAFLPMSAIIVVVAQVASRIITKVGAQALIVFGVLLAGFGLVYLSSLSVSSSYLGHLLPSIVLIAAGMGSVFVPITLTAVSGVQASDSGIASAMLNVCQQVGGTIGLSGLVTVFTTAVTNDAKSHAVSLHGPALIAHSFTHGADMAFRAGALIMVVGLVAAFVLIRFRTQDIEETPTAPAA